MKPITQTQAILDMVDRGKSYQQTAAALSLPLKTVQRTAKDQGIGQGGNAFENMIRRGSMDLIAAIRRHHPEKVSQ